MLGASIVPLCRAGRLTWGIGDESFVKMLAVADLGDAFGGPFRSNVPVLLVSGTLDGRAGENDARRVGGQFERASYVTIDGASHDFWFLRPHISEITNARSPLQAMRGPVPPANVGIIVAAAGFVRPTTDEWVRQIETNCTGAHRNGPKQTQAAIEKPEQTRADRSERECQHRPLDHGIGVRIPASQPQSSR
jgi:hypothetical protein